MSPFLPPDFSTQLAAAQTLISLQRDVEASLEQKLADMREIDDVGECQQLLCQAQLEFVLLSVRSSRMDKEREVEHLEKMADAVRDGTSGFGTLYETGPFMTMPAPALSRGGIPTDDSGLTITPWTCTACGATGEVKHPPDIRFSDLITRSIHESGGHKCSRMGGAVFAKIGLSLTPEDPPTDHS